MHSWKIKDLWKMQRMQKYIKCLNYSNFNNVIVFNGRNKSLLMLAFIKI